MGNVLYEFLPGRTMTPYVGAGVASISWTA
jgi:hypothetical protein